ncbi:NAD-dependent succinate-semialdehyde dehydrogenase [Caballeronia sp. LZ033]|uniref:NAD-dependent succinate-semialdehyde dehydrogenase n=1 Tax=Caballeronia sp. LZ033 TaxID=3038566 RepID=UPI00285B7A78|nr:NAD-dependent succinate-semialdehyde dehydrogenase [Caballeronia sp. LZ033]MDR5815440.1 NAD-dependent succinate-semialdehyde dehydrogenase [Caballeronia sp. LZ033]
MAAHQPNRAYSDTLLHIGGAWCTGGRSRPVVNPATEDIIGSVVLAEERELEDAVRAAQHGFAVWRKTAAFERSKLMRQAAHNVRSRAEAIAVAMTMEQGKPLAEARLETLAAADTIEWFAEEARRTYGRVIPARVGGVTQIVTREPVGIVAAFTPWNFPLNQAVRKVSAALAAGCSIILKGPEETPASCAALVQAFVDAGLPEGVLNLVFGVPADVSSYLIAHPAVAKISFTGSTQVGKLLASMAGQHMKRATMELGGHAPAIVFADADLPRAAKLLAAAKFRNAGQVCISPTRFLVEEKACEAFTQHFVAAARALETGDGLHEGVQMGPLANARRVEAMERLVADALAHGAKLALGGHRPERRGFFFEPTVLTGVPLAARVMNEEPFGPIAPIVSFRTCDEVIAEANRLPVGLAAYAYSGEAGTLAALSRDIESGMISLNHHGLGLPETPFGGVKESGYGSEGGTEAMEAYLVTKFVSQMA